MNSIIVSKIKVINMEEDIKIFKKNYKFFMKIWKKYLRKFEFFRSLSFNLTEVQISSKKFL